MVLPEYAKTSNLYYAAVNLIKGRISTTNSRTAAIVSSSSTITQAEKKCEEGLKFISGDNIYVRHDIAKPDLINKRIRNMEELR